MNMVKGPDGKMVPDFAVDGKGANDMKSGVKMKKEVKRGRRKEAGGGKGGPSRDWGSLAVRLTHTDAVVASAGAGRCEVVWSTPGVA